MAWTYLLMTKVSLLGARMPLIIKDSITPPKRLSDRVKELLKDAIFKGDLKQGEKLPPESQIASDLGVSKVTVREALREIESEGLIEKRRGTHGGSFVSEPGYGRINEFLKNSYLVGGFSPHELTEFRRILEPAIADLASERRTEEDLIALKENIEACERSLKAGRIDHAQGIRFHCIMADACGNRLISAVMGALASVFEEILSRVPMSVEDAMIDLDYSKKFYTCLVEGKGREARRLMEAHFDILMDIIARKEAGRTGSEKNE
jgi:GntR family transcriptional repressor for pyruvate dehydrogenase complex